MTEVQQPKLRKKPSGLRVVEVWHDDDPLDPLEDSGWEHVSFGRRHSNHKDPDEYVHRVWTAADLAEMRAIAARLEKDDADRPRLVRELKEVRARGWIELISNEHRRMRNEGLLFPLSYFEHGNCLWSLRGGGPQCRWDSVDFAGLLIWTDKPEDMPEGLERRAEIARGFLETYTAWCNGEVYGYTIEGLDGRVLDSCGGFYGDSLDHMAREILDAVGGDPAKVVRWEGDCADLITAYHWPPKAKE